MSFPTPPATQRKALVRYDEPEEKAAALSPQLHQYFAGVMGDILNRVDTLGVGSPAAYTLSYAFLRGSQELFRRHGGSLEQLPNDTLPASSATIASVREICKQSGMSAQAAQKVVTAVFGTPSQYGATGLIFDRDTKADFVVQDEKDLTERVKSITMPLGPDFAKGKDWCLQMKVKFVEALLKSEYLPTTALTVANIKIDGSKAKYQKLDEPTAIEIANLFFDIFGSPGVHHLADVVAEPAAKHTTGFDPLFEAANAMNEFANEPVIAGFFESMTWSGDLTSTGRSAVRETLGLVGAVLNWRNYTTFVQHLQDRVQPTTQRVLNAIGEGPWQTPELAVKHFICNALRGWDMDRINGHLNIARVYAKMEEKCRSMIIMSPKGTRTRVNTIGSARMLAAITVFFTELDDYKRTVNPIGAALYPCLEAFITQPRSNHTPLILPIREFKTRGRVGGEPRTLASIAQQVIDVCGHIEANN